jgi:hypothetical protein
VSGSRVKRERPEEFRMDHREGLFVFVAGPPLWGPIVFEHPTPKTLLLMAIVVWSFCRFYYFGFYVLERYVDPNYKFSGLISMVWYVMSGHKGQVEVRHEEKT